MSLPKRKEFIICEIIEQEIKDMFQMEFDESNENMIQWILTYLITLANQDDEKRIHGRFVEGLVLKAGQLFENQIVNKQSITEFVDYFIERLNLYPHVYFDLYDKVVTKDVFCNQTLEFLTSVLNSFSIVVDLNFDNPYTTNIEPIITIKEENNI